MCIIIGKWASIFGLRFLPLSSTEYMLVQKAAPAEEEGVDTDSDSGDKEIILTIMKKGGLRIGCRSNQVDDRCPNDMEVSFRYLHGPLTQSSQNTSGDLLGTPSSISASSSSFRNTRAHPDARLVFGLVNTYIRHHDSRHLATEHSFTKAINLRGDKIGMKQKNLT
jgi:hypothetical protein